MKRQADIPTKTRGFRSELERLDVELARLRQDAKRSPGDVDLVEAVEELSATVEELHTVEEQLREQNEKLLEARGALEDERRRYQELFEFAAAGLLVTDTNGTIREANLAAAALLGVGQRHMAGKPLSVFVAEPDRPAFYGLLRRLQRVDRILGWELELQPRSGAPLPVDLTVAAMPETSTHGRARSILRWSLRDVRERRQTEKALRDNEARLRAILDTAVDAIITIDERGVVQSVNPATERMFGYGAEELVGRNVNLLMPSPYREEHDGYIARYLETGEARIIGVGREVSGRRKDGSTFPVDLGVSELKAREGRMFTGILRDISERRAAEEGRLLYEQMVAASNDLMAFVDRDYTYRAVNERYTEVFGLARDDIVGRTAADLVGVERFETIIRPRYDECLSGRSVHYEHWLELPRWGQRCFDIRLDPYYGDEEGVRGVLVDARDVTERKRFEEDAARRRAELAHAGRLATIGELASSVTHELKQPLTAILTYARACSRLLAAGQSEKLVQALADISEQAKRAVRVTERLRKFGRRETFRREPIDVDSTIEEITGLVRHDLDMHAVALRYERDGKLPLVTADKLEIQQVLANLIRNAVDAMDANGAEERLIVIRATAAKNRVRITVSDTGPGLPEEKPERLMESFFTTKPDGTGLGLSISRGIIEAHGGRLWAAPNAGRGATFHFTLPSAEPQKPPGSRNSAERRA